ncbi:divergent protein kinase domain 1C-like [Macrobrachium nipponense]|uniref:divergent protein kinase domain 1C-like n=1 Tax=Macrobrachium nipponense TaxID=159736 RepID=UPI0030C80B25
MRLSLLFPCCIARAIENMFSNRRKRRTCVIWSCIIGSLVAVFLVISIRDALLASSVICSTEEVISRHIVKLCADVKKEGIVSYSRSIKVEDLCHDLCEEDITTKLECKAFHLNKPTVFVLNQGNIKVVKSAINAEEREEALGETEEEYWNTKAANPYIPSKDEFMHMVNIYVGNFIDGEVNQDILSRLTDHSNVYQGDIESMVNHRNFWLLTQDHEFLTSLLFEEYNIFPKVLGTCGIYYSMEYFQPLTKNAMRPFDFSWRERLWKALDIVKYVGRLDSVWTEPLHLCDVKHDHFGWSDENKVSFLDLDSILTDSVLIKTLEHTPACTDNEDCSYFDCKGKCHHKTAKCGLERTNTNLQVICDKIFLGNTDGLISLYGLLVSHEANEELLEALELCRTNRGMTVDGIAEVIKKAASLLMY